MYGKGSGVAEDKKKALEWYRKAADQGYAPAQLNLGLVYDQGDGIPADPNRAFKWYRLAAEQGLAEAQMNLGYLFGTGRGAPQDYLKAHLWYSLALSKLQPGAERDLATNNRDIVAGLMDPAQIAEAQKMAEKWNTSRGE